MLEFWLLAALIFAAALLYSSVGHAGASGYIAAMGLCGVAANVMRPSALLLNVIVATIGTIRFYRAGCFSRRLFLAFSAGSVPIAFMGGRLTLPPDIYKPVVGVILLLSALRLALEKPRTGLERTKPVPIPLAIFCGAAIGLLSGLTGVGGGIFLSPLLLFTRWATTRETAGVSVAFILVTSIAVLLGIYSTAPALPNEIALWLVSATLGGLIGSEFGSKRFRVPTLRKLLAVVLAVAGLKMIFV